MILWRRAWQPTPVFLPGESHGQRSLAGYSPWGPKELDRTERLSTDHDLLRGWDRKFRNCQSSPSLGGPQRAPLLLLLWAQAGKVNLSRRLEGGAGVLLRAAGRPPILPTPALTLQTRTKAAMRLGISPEFSGPFLAPAALGCTLTPPGTAKFSLVLPGQAISSRERESSAEVTRKITHEQGPAPSCFR